MLSAIEDRSRPCIFVPSTPLSPRTLGGHEHASIVTLLFRRNRRLRLRE